MFKKLRFKVTEEHLKLSRRAYVDWDDCEFGAPAIDCKRPYGNSYVHGDIAEIIGIPLPDRDEGQDFTDQDIKRMDDLHKDMQIVLQIGLRTGEFRVGEYECEKYSVDWKVV